MSVSLPDRITPGNLWIGRSNVKNGLYHTTKLLHSVARVYMNMKELDIINYGNSNSASRPDPITPGNLWIGRSNVNNGLYHNTKILNGVARISIKIEGTLHY
jgi:hypothetical protein